MKIHWIQHVAFEGLGTIKEWINDGRHQLTCTRQFMADPLPHPDTIDMLIIMGGPMGVYDHDLYPWLKQELAFIQKCMDAGKAVLGICLGAQLIAATLGARVYPGTQKEIGWFPITLLPNAFINDMNIDPMVFHWHGDTFDLPEKATLIASSELTPNQAFSYRNALALQFHLEQSEATIEAMLRHGGDELAESGIAIQSADDIRATKAHFESCKIMLFRMLDRLCLINS